MAADIRLVALDLDGTLLNPQNRVSEADAAALRAVVAAGVRVVLATSRWYHAARRTAQQLGLEGPLICHNGALVRGSDGGDELLHLRIDGGLARQIGAHLDTLTGDAYVTVDDRTFVRPGGQRDWSRLPPDMELVSSIAGAVTTPPTAFLVFGREAVRSAVELFRTYHDSEINLAEGFSESFPDYLNIVHARANKGTALVAVCGALKIPPEATMAMGDAAPDIPLLRAAGIGVAMGNAAPAVKEAAVAVAPANDAGGVAWALHHYVIG